MFVSIFLGHLKLAPNYWDYTLCVDLGITHQRCKCPIAVELPVSCLCNRGGSRLFLAMLRLKHCPDATSHYLCRVLPEILINLYCAAPVCDWVYCWTIPNLAPNHWSAHFQNSGSVAETGYTSIPTTLIFLSFVSLCAAAIEKSKYN